VGNLENGQEPLTALMDNKATRSLELQKRFHRVIPGGSHTYAKGDDQYPTSPPIYITRGKGCHVWDAEGNEYIEYAMGLRSVTLGHAYQPVVDAVARELLKGSNFNRPATIELECAEKLLELVPGAEMVKFAKNGSDANDAAVKLARAYTGRDLVAICRDQPFFSVGDWFIGTTPMNAGIPQAVRELTVGFHYNDLAGAAAVFRQHPGKIAAVVLEVEKETPPVEGFLTGLRDLCHKEGALLILDEMITGFRWHNGGAQTYYNLVPDLSTFGKALGNGFSVSALAGRREIMRLGGLDHDQPRVFLLSTTHGAETHALAAGLAVLNTYQREPVVQVLWEQGRKLAAGINRVIVDHKLEGHFTITGQPCCLTYGTRDAEKHPSQPFRTLFLQEMIRHGILAPSFVISYSHSDADIEKTIQAVHAALSIYRKALTDGVEKYLQGRPVKPVARRYN
jgi:glutamate-1-semialdehyde 2,1-aminomutase